MITERPRRYCRYVIDFYGEPPVVCDPEHPEATAAELVEDATLIESCWCGGWPLHIQVNVFDGMGGLAAHEERIVGCLVGDPDPKKRVMLADMIPPRDAHDRLEEMLPEVVPVSRALRSGTAQKVELTICTGCGHAEWNPKELPKSGMIQFWSYSVTQCHQCRPDQAGKGETPCP